MPPVYLSKCALLIIQESSSGDPDQADWVSKIKHELPDWVLSPDVISRLRDGEIAHNASDPESKWYRALRGSITAENAKQIARDYLAENIEWLTADDARLGTRKWLLLIQQELDQVQIYRLSTNSWPHENSEMAQSLQIRLRILMEAAKKSRDAYDAVPLVIDQYNEKRIPLPSPLTKWQDTTKCGTLGRPRPHGPSKFTNWGRDLFIAQAIFILEQTGLRPTRRDDNNRISGCDVVSAAYMDLVKKPLSYQAAKAIWKRYSNLKTPLSDF